MNERIRELVKQAGGHFSTHTLTSYPAQHRESIELWDKNIEKFAELIVRECISVMDNTAKEARENFTYMDNDVPTTAHQFEIRKHFGVEK